MPLKRLDMDRNQIVIHSDGPVCETAHQLVHSDAFQRVFTQFVRRLRSQEAPLLTDLSIDLGQEDDRASFGALLRSLAENSLEQASQLIPLADHFLTPAYRKALGEFVEQFYSFWRAFDRFMVLHAVPGAGAMDKRPYRAFNESVESLTHLVRGTYRDMCENILGDHPRVYRQVPAGCNAALIATPGDSALPEVYAATIGGIPIIRQVWLDPPLILESPTNRRSGEFQRVDRNPLAGALLEKGRWLCYPAQVGPLVIFVCFNQEFMSMGVSLANLFELATDDQIASGPDAIYAFGVPADVLAGFGETPTVFYDDDANSLLVAAVPFEEQFGYFGYLKKMILTLHNVAMMKRGRLPYHGAMVHIDLKNHASANLLIIGDTGTGKSECLEAFRQIGGEALRTMRIIADDMGSLDIRDNATLLAYGTEIGAFIRLDDLQQGYAFGEIDRAIIMNPYQTNARVILPVTTLQEVLRGYAIDFLLYANNHETVDNAYPIIERFSSPEEALEVFRAGAAMAKGTTTATGLVHSYFANIFGPPQYREVHEALAQKVFHAAFEAGVFVGQLRTRLGIPGSEQTGPVEAAQALFKAISDLR